MENPQLTEEQIRQVAYDQGVADATANRPDPLPVAEPTIEEQIEAAQGPPDPCCKWLFTDNQGTALHTDALSMTASQVRTHLLELDTNKPENSPHRAGIQA